MKRCEQRQGNRNKHQHFGIFINLTTVLLLSAGASITL